MVGRLALAPAAPRDPVTTFLAAYLLGIAIGGRVLNAMPLGNVSDLNETIDREVGKRASLQPR